MIRILQNFTVEKSVSWALFGVLCLILAVRPIGVAEDDYSYLNYFEYGAASPESYRDSLFWIEEPLWRLYVGVTGRLMGPENALRFLIFLSSSLFLYSSRKIAGRGTPWILLNFIIAVPLGMQMYFNQLRQGFALSLFLAFTAFFGRPWIGAILASLIHSSFLVVLGCLGVMWLCQRFSLKYWVGLLIVAFGLLSVFELREYWLHLAGRRTDAYVAERVMNVNYYIFTILQFSVTLALTWYKRDEWRVRFWFFCASVFTANTALTLVHEAGGRIYNYAIAFVTIYLASCSNREGGRFALIWWTGSIGLLNILALFSDDLISRVADRWMLVLGL